MCTLCLATWDIHELSMPVNQHWSIQWTSSLVEAINKVLV